jgi:hypothetical protein
VIQWRKDMENAPRDGSRILLSYEGWGAAFGQWIDGYWWGDRGVTANGPLPGTPTAWASINAPEGDGV